MAVRTRSPFVALALVGVLALSGCGLFGSDGTPTTDGATTRSTDQGEEGTDAGPGTARVADQVMGEQTVATPHGSGDAHGGEVTTTLRALEVSGDTMTLRWALRWDDDDAPDDEGVSYYDMGVSPVATVTDPVHLVAYRPFCTEGAWQPEGSATDRGLEQLYCRESMLVSPLEDQSFAFPNHGTVEAYAVLPAPEGEVETLDVLPAEGLPAFTGVEVTYLDAEE